MANTRFKVDNGLNVVGDADFFGNVTVSRNVTTANLTVTNRITIPGGLDLNTQLASAANTVAVANNTLAYSARKVKFVDSPSLSVQVADNGTESTFSFTVASVVPGAQGYQGIQGAQGTQGVIGIQGTQGIQGRQGVIGTQGIQGFQGAGFQGTQGSQGIQGSVGIGGGVRHTFNNSADVTVNPGTSNFRFNINSVSGEPSVQEITINDLDLGASNVRNFIATWDDSTSSPGGYLIITDNTNQKQIIFNVTAVSSLTGYSKATVTHVSGTYPTNGAACKLEFAKTGGFGTQGTQGIQGLVGVQGTQGAQGRQGTQGAQGYQGIQGLIGIQGAIGIQGTQGTAGPSTTINATDDTTTASLYPVFVGAAGSAQTAKTTTSKILFNAASGELKTKLRSYTENVVSSTITTSYTADLSQSNIFDLTLISGSTTITFTNAPAPGTAVSATLILRQPGAVSNTVSYANTVNWSFSEAPILAAGPSKLDTVTLITLNGGITFFATHALANVAY